ncbi:MAG: sigma-54-dependent Fis family transcriptional regulator [Deltaproteobacteria bacterium]|nr:sigma-54-dependent Fis family transcriptional regulator [Deltaproteobacteria bacterium]
MLETRKRVLIVDDEAGVRDSLRLLLKSSFDVHTAEDGQHALTIVDDIKPDLILLDVLMPNLDGMQTLKQLKEKSVDVPVIMLTATNTVKTAVQAMKWGAIDYLSKPFEVEELTSLIVGTLSLADSRNAEAEAPNRRHIPAPDADFGPMVGKSSAMRDLFQKVKQVAERDTTVLITGESGTGKELIAHQIHQLSPRRDAPFIAINCAAIPETLIESELFGHERGAFTHAVERRLGHCELADGGTLFLDEIGELSLPVQVKMLRFLQEQEFYRVGRSKPIKVDVRIIAATNKNLEELIRAKTFRQDLYYRINVIGVPLPPLRDRYEDIPHLVQHFIAKFSPVYGGKKIELSADAMSVLVQYDWPGNVRELENVMESLMALCQHEQITEADLPRKLKSKASSDGFRPAVFDESIKFEEAEKMFESEMIIKALRKTNYVQTRAAELLGISRRILKYKMDKLGISDKPEMAAVTAGESSEE